MTYLVLENVSKHFGGIKSVSNVSFTVNKGEITGLIGPNGAGKTTTFNLITGFLPLTSGKIFLGNKPIHGLKPHRIAKMGLVRTFQSPSLFNDLTVLENIIIGVDCHNKVPFWQAAFSLPQGRQRENNIKEQAFAILEQMELEHLSDKITGNLSFGEQRLVETARALAANPHLLLLDEPAGGLNPDEADRFTELLLKIKQANVGIFLIEHNMRLVMGICDRVIVFNFGEKIAEGTPDEIQNNDAVIDAYLGKKGDSA